MNAIASVRYHVALFVALLAALFGSSSAVAFEATPAHDIAAYTYDSHRHAAPIDNMNLERGPPAQRHRVVGYGPVDRWSHGVSARIETVASGSMTAHPALRPRVQLNTGTTTTSSRIAVGGGDRVSLQRSPVATNTGSDVGLSDRGLRPLPGTRVVPEGIPENWRSTGTDSPGGTQYSDPNNPGNSVRVMQGNPNSPYPNSQTPYVRWQQNGQSLDMYGNQLPSAKSPDAHIPLGDFTFRPGLFP